MKFLCYGDFHIRELGSFQPYNKIDERNGLTYELNNAILASEHVASVIVAEKPDVVVDLGDFFHDKNTITTKVLYAANICCNNIKEACEEVGAECYMLLGNHNLFNELNNINNCDILSGFFSVVNFPRIIDFAGFKIGLVPYSSKPELVKQVLSDYSKECNLIFTHLEFAGCSYDSGKKAEFGYDPNLGIPCVSGHIHLRQEILDVVYIGSIIQNTFSTYSLENVGGVLVFNDAYPSEGKFYINDKSKHYVKVSSMDYFYNILDTLVNKSVLKVMLPKEVYDQHKELFDKFEHTFIPSIKNRDNYNLTQYRIEGEDQTDPIVLLKTYVLERLPECMPLLDKILLRN